MNKLRVFLSILTIFIFLFMLYIAFKDFEKLKEIITSLNRTYLIISGIFF